MCQYREVPHVKPLHLLLGDEEFLVERALASVLSSVRTAASNSDIQVSRVRAGDLGTAQLAELLSPSLFGEDRAVVFDAAHDAGKDAVALVKETAADLPDGVTLIVIHSGGGRAKALAADLQKRGAEVHRCGKLNATERAEFVRAEFRAHGVRVTPDVITAVLDAVGSNVRELASACSQLTADTGGKVDAGAVARYYSGRAEVSGFDVAEKAVLGNRAAALEALRWADHSGVPHVVLADALGETVRAIARVSAAGRGDPNRLAPQLGMPPWKVRKTQAQARNWEPGSLTQALRVIAELNGEVKGGAADTSYALERAVSRVAQLAK
ncbi:DNA polymerase III subunit delta [Hoyosella sp. YIM 151337]|uniref:DNA polymerase III subunit delta n=1 Tax=Hoyosella sp. YIM 151337 TaxID=2992742 RepID=UPI002235905E|nr:DNA polymerase III subunit delta [Hoyosella sp. YIM 151337]MCW4355274.1 DNA polymerase III subunit delta [Hoyosella sp. YIM 151337]